MAKNPTRQLPQRDDGASTLRNYSYQSAYGVVLLAGAVAGKNDYRAIWCEQEEDLLAEISDNLFDSYQVKTRTPEIGYWNIRDDGFVAAIKVFIHLEKTFSTAIRYYNFISDAQLLDSEAKDKIHLCPGKLIEAAQLVKTEAELFDSAKKGFAELVKRAQCNSAELFAVFKRLRLQSEPLRKESVIAELVANHLPGIPCCFSATSPKLRRAAVNLIDQLDEAARLSSQAPERHYACLKPQGEYNPHLRNKRVSLEDFVARCTEAVQPGFRYIPEIGKSLVAQTNPDIKRFYKKLSRGKLENYADTLRNRGTSSSAILLDLATRPDGPNDVHHLKALVKGECDDAHALASQNPEPFGLEMYRSVLQKLDNMALNEPGKALRQPKEILIGIAAILTEECKVWWSKPFDLNSEP